MKCCNSPLYQATVLSENLKALMRKHGINAALLARKSKVGQPTLHKILKGLTLNPRVSTLRLLSSYFDIEIDTLITKNRGQLFHRKLEYSSLTGYVPILSWEDCLGYKNLLPELSKNNWHQWIFSDYGGGKDKKFAVISKPSMAPRIKSGEVLIILPNLSSMNDGDIVMVNYPNTDETTLRIICLDGPIRCLKSLNNRLEMEDLTPDIKIIGIVIQSIFQYYQL